MKRPVRVLRAAQNDLLEIAGYLSREAPTSPQRQIEPLLATLDRLESFAERGFRPRDLRLRGLGFRVMVSGRYLIFYKILPRQIRIYRVLHQRRAYQQLL